MAHKNRLKICKNHGRSIRLQTFPIVEGKTGPYTIDLLSTRITALGAVKKDIFIVDCETFTQPTAIPNVAPRSVNVLHDSEMPVSVFSLLDTGTKIVPLVADSLFDLLMLKMAPWYVPKKNLKIESKGPRFEAGDFIVKLGSVSMGGHFKGILVEVEYTACCVPQACWDLMKEFIQGFLGSHGLTAPPQAMQVYDTIYSILKPHGAW
ncbi:hypothetical protein QYM36_009770 [Artemia franciscana]|uniref:Mediator of RNA polymerase II transcription subunit 20 n=1 Tax=Artemia franciscana TaxID=6661 RepID=A0AA88HTU6_ARTSF|nr:hypothetical protein QYM36_009770 [Artemia franciscana]